MRHLSIPTLPFLTLALLLISAQGSPSYAEGQEGAFAEWELQEGKKYEEIDRAQRRAKAEQEREEAIEYAYGGKKDLSVRRDEEVGDIAGKYGMGETAEIPQNADAERFLNAGQPRGYVDNDGNYVCTYVYQIGCQEEQNQLKHACSGYGSRKEREKCTMRLSFERENNYNEYMAIQRDYYEGTEHVKGPRGDTDSEYNQAMSKLGYNASEEEVAEVNKWYEQGGIYEQSKKQRDAALKQDLRSRTKQDEANRQAYKAQKQYEAAVASGDQTAIADASAKRDATRQQLEAAKQQKDQVTNNAFEEIYRNRGVQAVGPANRTEEHYAGPNGKDGRNEPLGRREQAQRDYEKAIENEFSTSAAQQDARSGLAKAQSDLDKAQAHEKATSKSMSDEARSQAAAKTQAAQAKYDVAMQTMATRSQQAYQAKTELTLAAYNQMAEIKGAQAEAAQKDFDAAKQDLAAAEEKEAEARAAHEAAKASGSKAQEARAAAALAAAKEETNVARFDMLSAQSQAEKAGYESATSATDARAAQLGMSTASYADMVEKMDKVNQSPTFGTYDPSLLGKEAGASPGSSSGTSSESASGGTGGAKGQGGEDSKM